MPYSGVYPFYAQHMMAGIFCATAKLSFKAKDFEFIPVYIAQGSSKATLEAVQKLVFFEGVDLLIGMVSLKVLDDLKPILENHQKLGLFFDFGELVPPKEGFGLNIASISMNLWQSQYALGNWAVKEFGTDGQIVSPLYETGFNLNVAFLNGAAAAGASGTAALNNFVLPEAYANSELLNLEPFFEAIDKETPAFVHAIFTGKMGNAFLEQWRSSKFYNTVPLTTVENMAYQDILHDVSHLGLKFYAASSWQRKSETPNNRDFVKRFEEFGKQEANVFGMLGYETGLAIATMMPFLRKGDALAAIQFLNNQKVIGPRGELNLQNQSSNLFPVIDINKINTNTTAINQTVVAQSSAIAFDTSTIYQETVSGWLNPYLSV